jgi:hypothetical protein
VDYCHVSMPTHPLAKPSSSVFISSFLRPLQGGLSEPTHRLPAPRMERHDQLERIVRTCSCKALLHCCAAGWLLAVYWLPSAVMLVTCWLGEGRRQQHTWNAEKIVLTEDEQIVGGRVYSMDMQ